jgi:hypothetical protein
VSTGCFSLLRGVRALLAPPPRLLPQAQRLVPPLALTLALPRSEGASTSLASCFAGDHVAQLGQHTLLTTLILMCTHSMGAHQYKGGEQGMLRRRNAAQMQLRIG